MNGFDLHTHSKASDGLLQPAQLVKRAQGRVDGIALTDHDSIGGLPEALAVGENLGLPVVPGVEWTTDYGRYEVHILGYFIDHLREGLRDKLDSIVRSRVERARQIVSKLNKLGFVLSWEEIERQSPGVYIGRPHILRALIANGSVKPQGSDQFFRDYLVSGAPAFVAHKEISAAEAVGHTLAAGGLPVLAHPGRMGGDEILPDLLNLGIRGLEVHYPSHTSDDVLRYGRIARERGLIATGGSDFHGDMHGVALGDATADAGVVEALARASGRAGQAFLAGLHSRGKTRE